jgi:hypothetical protein
MSDENLSEEDVDRIAGNVAERLAGDRPEPAESAGWYPGKYLSEWYPGKYASMFLNGVRGGEQGIAPAIQDNLRTVGQRFAERNAVYKTKLQKGGRIVVPDAEIETLELEDGDTLQVVLTPVGNAHEPDAEE